MAAIVGLTTEKASQLLKQFGPNEITAKAASNAALTIFLSQFTSILVILLLSAAVISFVIGDALDAIFILLIVLINSILGFTQEYKAEKAIAALKKIAVSTVRVIRDGAEKEIDSRFLVPGDIIKIEEGDKIAADAKLLQAINLEINEATLTGESLPVFKEENEEGHDQIFWGTIVTRGRGMAVVQNTGRRTRFGAIAESLAEIKEEKTPLERQLGVLGKQLGIIAILASLLVFIFGMWRQGDFFVMFLTGISLAVAAVPEGLPVILTITLALGVSRMARQRAITRKLSAIETLGAASIIATDKTGTITENKMEVKQIFSEGENEELLKIGVIVNTASLVFKHDGGGFDILGDPTEGALLVAAHKNGLSPEKIREGGELVDEFSFDTKTKTMSVVWKEKSGVSVYVKGAPETILSRSTHVIKKGKVVELIDRERQRIERAFSESASRGFRIIAMAEKPFDPERSRRVQGKHSKLKVRDRDNVESDLTFVGFVALYDPPRGEIAQAAHEAEEAGIKTIMITGDNELTANAIAEQVGLIKEGEDILTGSELDALNEEELIKILPKVRIFARTTPEHKLRIVKAFQKLGHVVAVTGDGVNDALALKQANVGVAMGIAGTDVAREAADFVITDDNYASIVKAIEQGRVIFDNIAKSVLYLVSGNLSEILTILIAVVLGLPTIFFPVQILWINLVTDGLPALALAVDPKDHYIMHRKPRSLNTSLIGGANLRFALISGILIAAAVLASFIIGLFILDEARARTIAFTMLIILHIPLVFVIRKTYRIFTNKFLLFSVLFVFLLQFLIILIPSLHPIFKVVSLW